MAKSNKGKRQHGHGRKRTTLLLDQHRAVLDEYMRNGFNQKQALIKCGYAESTALKEAAQVFMRPEVVAELERRLRKASEKADLSAEWIIQRLMAIAMDREVLARFRRVNEEGHPYWDFTGATTDELASIGDLTTETYVDGKGEEATVIKKLKIGRYDVLKALEMLARTQGMFKDNVKVSADDDVVAILNAGMKRLGDGNGGEKS